ncbi:PRD domain-containing protein [Bombilactobacillus bombi]|uniref:PRD domain-containing protein n=1 Tax=Bombilactobacillus bombi TaxID=1303590 RepID=UPI000E591CF8|nr:PRD domain-containing protein [Bombilactobacillus bombi]AXX65415.1 PRD domain-containing protein [Bombilactobacillus bombi]
MSFSINEAGFLAIHFIENELSLNSENRINNIEIKDNQSINQIIKIILNNLQIKDQHANIKLDRLITHLNFLLNRIRKQQHFQDNHDDKKLNDSLRRQFPQISKICDQISTLLLSKYYYKLSKSEEIYLIMHIQQVAKQLDIRKDKNK